MAWTAPRTWVLAEFVTAALMNTHVRDNMLFLKSDPLISQGTAVLTSAPSTTVTAITLSGVAIPADVGAVYVEVWSANGIGYNTPPGSGSFFSYSMNVTETTAGVLIEASESIFSTTNTDGSRMAPGFYARSLDLSTGWPGSSRTFTLNVSGSGCNGVLGASVMRVMRAY